MYWEAGYSGRRRVKCNMLVENRSSLDAWRTGRMHVVGAVVGRFVHKTVLEGGWLQNAPPFTVAFG